MFTWVIQQLTRPLRFLFPPRKPKKPTVSIGSVKPLPDPPYGPK